MTSAGIAPWQRLLADLKRRRVFRVMTLYGVAGFAVLQAADLLVPVLLLPDWTYRFIGLALLAGFPVAIALAWAFDFTGDGLRRTEPAAAAELAVIVARPRRQRWPAGLLALGATVLLISGGWYAVTRDERAAASADAPPTLAVLPFANLARTTETEPFVDGVHDDLLTQLSKIGAVRVISRTSVLGYRETTRNIRDIAGELGATHIVEGGVQRSGDQVRINVQLIDARTDGHLWAETYNRTLTVANVFAIQSEIAGAIAAALHTRLSPEVRRSIAEQPTGSLQAYDHYQRGLAYFRRTLVAGDVMQAVREFEAAIAIDPAFADAWSRLAIARLTLSWDMGLTHQVAAAQEAVTRAEALAPERLLTHLARGYYHYYGLREYDAALAAFARAETLAPGEPEVLMPAGWTLRRMGRWEEALAKFEGAFARDPRNWDNVVPSIAQSLLVLRRYDDAQRYALLGVSFAPDLGAGHSTLALLHILASGDTAAAAAAVEHGGSTGDIARILFDFPVVSRTLAPRFAPRLRALTSAVASRSGDLVSPMWLSQDLTPPAFHMQMAHMLRAVGERDLARVHFDSARIVMEPLLQQTGTAVWSGQGSLHGALGVAYAALGRHDDAIRSGRLGLQLAARNGDAVTEPMRRAELAEIYVLLDEHDRALDELERLLAQPSWVSAAALRVDPIWAPLRANPRFRRLVQAPEGAASVPERSSTR